MPIIEPTLSQRISQALTGVNLGNLDKAVTDRIKTDLNGYLITKDGIILSFMVDFTLAFKVLADNLQVSPDSKFELIPVVFNIKDVGVTKLDAVLKLPL